MKKKKYIKPLEEYVDIENDLRDSIKQAYEVHGISQHRLGKAAGIHPIQIGWFVKGEKTLSLPTIAKIARAVKKLETERIGRELSKIEKSKTPKK